MDADNTSNTQEQMAMDESQRRNRELEAHSAIYSGNASETDVKSLEPLCIVADRNYHHIQQLIKRLKQTEQHLLKVLHLNPDEIKKEQIQEEFTTIKLSYRHLGRQINEGIKYVYKLARKHPQDLLVQNVYKIYLAKLLASLETRNPVQKIVSSIAEEKFVLDRIRFDSLPFSHYNYRLKQTEGFVVMLEVRYQKRHFANLLRKGAPLEEVAEKVEGLLGKDPLDVNTYIWLTKLSLAQLKYAKQDHVRSMLQSKIKHLLQTSEHILERYIQIQGITDPDEKENITNNYQRTLLSLKKESEAIGQHPHPL